MNRLSAQLCVILCIVVMPGHVLCSNYLSAEGDRPLVLEFAEGDRLIVLEDDVPVMKKTDVLAKLSKGTTFIAGEITRNDHGAWIKPREVGIPQGWVSAKYLHKAGGIVGPKWRNADFGSVLEFFKDGTLKEAARNGRVFNGKFTTRADGALDAEIDGIFFGKNAGIWKTDVQKDDLTLEINSITLKYTALPAEIKLTDGVIKSLTLEKEPKYVEIRRSEPILVARGATETKKEEYTVKHSVSLTEGITWSASGNLKFGKDEIASIELGIKRESLKQTSRSDEESKTTSREVTIPGNGKHYRVIWYETFRKGKAVMIVKGEIVEFPFEYRDGWDLRIKEVEIGEESTASKR